jgi:hypothetical protein
MIDNRTFSAYENFVNSTNFEWKKQEGIYKHYMLVAMLNSFGIAFNANDTEFYSFIKAMGDKFISVECKPVISKEDFETFMKKYKDGKSVSEPSINNEPSVSSESDDDKEDETQASEPSIKNEPSVSSESNNDKEDETIEILKKEATRKKVKAPKLNVKSRKADDEYNSHYSTPTPNSWADIAEEEFISSTNSMKLFPNSPEPTKLITSSNVSKGRTIYSYHGNDTPSSSSQSISPIPTTNPIILNCWDGRYQITIRNMPGRVLYKFVTQLRIQYNISDDKMAEMIGLSKNKTPVGGIYEYIKHHSFLDQDTIDSIIDSCID